RSYGSMRRPDERRRFPNLFLIRLLPWSLPATHKQQAKELPMRWPTGLVTLLATAALMIFALTAGSGQGADEPWNVPPLKDAFRRKFLIGTALNYPALLGQAPMDVAIAARHFSAITCGNSMKPDFTQPEEGRFTFEQGDRCVEIARKCGATPIGHTLVWHSQTPAWFFRGSDGKPPSRELALARMRNHISTLVGHFTRRRH